MALYPSAGTSEGTSAGAGPLPGGLASDEVLPEWLALLLAVFLLPLGGLLLV